MTGVRITTGTVLGTTWPFALVAWLGDVSAVLLIAVRTYRLIFHPENVADAGVVRPVE